MKERVRNIGSHLVDELRLGFLTSTIRQFGNINTLLDLGCGEKPYLGLYHDQVNHAIGIDVPYSPHEHNMVDVFSDGQRLPFANATFEVVLCSEVMEHTPEPNRLLSEVNRVLVPGGLLILTTPLLVPEHEAPYDFYRYTRYGLRYLLDANGFVVKNVEPFGEIVGVLLSFAIQIQMKFWNILGKVVRWHSLSSVFNPLVFLLAYLPQIIYLASIRILRKTTRGEITYQKYSYTTKGFGVLAQKNS